MCIRDRITLDTIRTISRPHAEVITLDWKLKHSTYIGLLCPTFHGVVYTSIEYYSRRLDHRLALHDSPESLSFKDSSRCTARSSVNSFTTSILHSTVSSIPSSDVVGSKPGDRFVAKIDAIAELYALDS